MKTNYMGRLSITWQLGLGFGLLMAMLAALGFFSIYQAQGIEAEMRKVTENLVPKQKRLVEIETEVYRIDRAMRTMLIEGAGPAAQTQRSKIDASLKNIASDLAELQASIQLPRGKELLAEMQAAEKAFEASQGTFFEHFAATDADAARLHLLGASQEQMLKFITAMDALNGFQDELTDRAIAAAKKSSTAVKNITLLLIGLGVALGGLFAWQAVRSITLPIREAMAIADAVAKGDLTVHREPNGPVEVRRLLTALVKMRDQLQHVVGQVRDGAESVAASSAQIASDNTSLSARTEQQASALEQTSASMEEMGSTARQNADNAKQATQLAASASAVAVQGGEVVGQVVQTMKDINDSSKKISDIIGVIDGIAFQTNILALNAAVEAARAGEQGRGFAVVAGEVRSLAQRSAEAAREIKGLISASVERVDQGTALVDRAGDTMQEIVASIRRVTDIVGEISNASSEQEAGVRQVGEAVTHMDQSTQQNAALVEEGAASAVSLRQQAAQLVGAVRSFKLVSNADGRHEARPVAVDVVARTTKVPSLVAPVPSIKAKLPVPKLEATAVSRSNAASKGASGAGPTAPMRGNAVAKASPVAAVSAALTAHSAANEEDWESF